MKKAGIRSDQDFREHVRSALEQLAEKLDQRFASIETRLGLLEHGVSWIRGKLEEGNPIYGIC